LFFFANYEYFNQVQAVGIQTVDPAFIALKNNYDSPYVSKDLTIRLDYHLNDKNNLFLRYSHDGNDGFGESLINGDPSTWARNTNWADQGIIGVTTSLTPTIVNDVRFQYNYWGNHNAQAVPSDCSAPCAAGVLPTVYTIVGGGAGAVGPNFNAPQARNTRRFEPIESLSWQKGSHRFKFGGDFNITGSVGLWGFCTPMCVGAFSPTYLKAVGVSAYFPNVPQTITNDVQVLQLPVYNGGASIFSGVGVGVNSTPGAYNYKQNIDYNQYRAYFQDVWKIKSNFTFNYGLAWNAQTGFYPAGIPLPSYLTPILGSNLGPTQNNTREFQPAFGFAWSPFKDGKTVIRGGGGIYWDSTPGYYKLRTASSISPPGANRNTLAASAFYNNIPGIINLNSGTLIAVGAPLPIGALTTMTVGQFQNLVNQELPQIEAVLSPPNPQRSGPFPYPTINYAKQGVEIYPHSFPLARSYQTSLGVQRDLGAGWVLNADWARRQGENVSLGEIDQNLYNRFEGTRTPVPVIPLCTTTPDLNPADNCSSGAITVWTDQGRAIYEGLLMKATKRFSHRYQVQASYAYAHAYTDNVDVWNAVNYVSAGYGQYLPHQNLNIAGTVNLPWGFTLSMNAAFVTSTPVTPSIATSAGAYFPGTVPTGSSEPLPGVQIGSLNSGLSNSALTAAVNAYNTNYVGKVVNTQGVIIPDKVLLPTNYTPGSPTVSQDFRLTKIFTYKERYKLNIFGEMFNAFNISNLTGYSSALDVTTNANAVCAQGVAVSGNNVSCSFGQATARQGQTFGSAGPRAVQIGARFVF
jgi:hypothetical protein